MMAFVKILLLSFIVLISGCSSEVPSSPKQNWEGLDIWIESRPPVIRPGMMEFLVLANRDKRKPAFDLYVNLRMGPTGKWVQAIQDGHVGVYRRAMRVSDPATEILHVYIRRDGKETVLQFPLNYSSGTTQ